MQMLENDLMVDFETLGTEKDSIVLSSGICLFNRYTGEIYDSDYKEYDVRQQICDGLSVSPETVSWWRKTNPKEFNRLVFNSSFEYPSEYLKNLFVDMGKSYKYIWSRGCMDAHILQYHVPDLPYNIFKDVRTLDVFGIKQGRNTHNALEDCKNQIQYVSEVLRRCSVETVEDRLIKEMVPVNPAVLTGTPTS